MTSYRTTAAEIESHYAPARELFEELIGRLAAEAGQLDHAGVPRIWSGMTARRPCEASCRGISISAVSRRH